MVGKNYDIKMPSNGNSEGGGRRPYYKKNKQGGTYNMQIVNYKISDDFKRRKMWCMLNDTYNEENSWEVKFDILDIYLLPLYIPIYNDANLKPKREELSVCLLLYVY